MDVAEYDRDEIKAVLKEKAIELFKICDKDGKNYITKDDLLELTRELALTQEQVEFAFEKLDTDKNNFLTLDEFIDGFGLFLGVENEEEIDPETQLKYANAQELFDLCDEGSKGYVTKSDLTRLISELNLTSEQVNQIFDELDEDKNGFLTIYEFVNGFLDFVKENKTYEDQTDLTNSNSDINNLQNGYDKSQLETEVYGYRDRSDTNSSSSGRGLYQRQKSVDLLDPDAKQLFEKVGEDFSE